jgi:hypothetical protein
MFLDPAKMDYRVSPQSPAAKLGFKNFVMDNFGHTMTRIAPFWKEFERQTVITITPDQRGGAVYYTTDGTEPTSKSKKYTGPFPIDQSTLVKAITVNTKGEVLGFPNETFYTEVDKVVYPSWYQTLISGKQGQNIARQTVRAKVEVAGLVLINIKDEPDLIDASGGYNSGCFIDTIDPQKGNHWLKSGIQANMIIQGIENEKIIDITGLQKALVKYAGQTVSVKTVSGYESKTFQVQLP